MRRNQEVAAGVLVTGTVRQLRVSLVSEPNVSDEEKLSWLMFGHGPDGAGLGQRQAMAGAASALLGTTGGKRIIKDLGIDEFSIGTSDSGLPDDQQVVKVGKAISDSFALGYEQSLTSAASIVKITWQLSRRWQLVLRTGSPEATKESLLEFARRLDAAQALLLPGGFSNGDEPDGSGKYITAFLRSPLAADALGRLLDQRDGLALGICNGFQALVKLGLLPHGAITAPAKHSPTLTFNRIGRHQSGLVRTKIVSNRSPWLMLAEADAVYTVPVSHGEGRFLCPPDLLESLAASGQIAARYVDEQGNPTMDVRSNPNGSDAAVEAITSPDGRILGKMGHSERIGTGLYQNVPGRFDLRLFESLVRYYS